MPADVTRGSDIQLAAWLAHLNTTLRFNASFLLKATAVTALCCFPMALNDKSGFVLTAFLLPISLAWLVATEVRTHGQFEVRFTDLPNSVVEIDTIGGPYHQRLTRIRILAAGIFLIPATTFPMLHIVDPEPPERWLPLVALFAVGAVMMIGYSGRRTVLIEERQVVTDYLLFGCRWGRRRWQVREGDYLEIFLPNSMGVARAESEIRTHTSNQGS